MTGTQLQQEQVAAVLAKIGGGPADDDALLEVYDVGIEQISSAAELLRSLLPSAQIVVGADTGRLAVRASESQQEQVRAFVEQLQQLQTKTASQVKRYPRPSALSDADYSALTAMFPNASITADEPGDVFTVVGSAADQARFEQLLSQWRDIETDVSKPALTSISIDANTLARFESLRESLDNELKGIRFLASSRNDELLIWASPEQTQFLKDLVEQLAQAVAAVEAPQLNTYAIKVADTALLTELLQERYDQLRVLTGQNDQTLLVWATAKQHEEIGPFLEQLQAQLPLKPKTSVKAYQVSGMPPQQLQTAAGAITRTA